MSMTGMGAQLTAIMQVDALAFITRGSGYHVSPMVSIQDISGNGSGAVARATMKVSSTYIPTGGGGANYSHPQVTFDAPPGSTATATAVISGGGVIALTNLSGGSGYTAPPMIQFGSDGGGSGAMAVAYIVDGKVVNVVVVQPGSAYTSPPTVTFVAGLPNNTTATGTALLGAGGVIIGIALGNQGSGYTTTPNITIMDTMGGMGSGATAIPVMQLDQLFVYPHGSGYTTADPGTLQVTITGNGMNAAATATLSGQQVASVNVTSQGTGYIAEPPIRFAGGGGSGAAATAVLGQVNRTGMEVNSYTMRDNGGETSGLLVVSSGGANAFTCYKMSETGRLPGLENYAFSMGMAIECATADPWYAVEVGAGGFGSPHTGGCIMLRLGNPTCKGQLVTPEDNKFDGRIAYAIGLPQVGAPDTSLTFAIQLNGNISTQGMLAIGGTAGLLGPTNQATILASADNFKGLVVRAHSATANANLQEWQDTAGNVLGSIGASGAFTGSMETLTLTNSSSYTLDVRKGTLHQATTIMMTPTTITIGTNLPGNAAQEMTVLLINTLSSTLTIYPGSNVKLSQGSVAVPMNSTAALRFVSNGMTWYEVARTLQL